MKKRPRGRPRKIRRCRSCNLPLPSDATRNTRYHLECRPSRHRQVRKVCACGCGREIPLNTRGRPRRFFSTACRQRHFRIQTSGDFVGARKQTGKDAAQNARITKLDTKSNKSSDTTNADPRPTKPGRRPKLIRCFACPPYHEGWPRSKLRTKNKIPYCPAHYPDNGKSRWPACPNCGDAHLGVFQWNGSIETCTVTCGVCGFSGRALDYFDRLDVQVIAAPIEGRRC